MFGKTVFILKTIIIWGLLTTTLVEAARQKKDVHHMIFLNERKKPSKSHRYQEYDHHDNHKDNRPKKSRKKQGGKKHKDPISIEESVEDISSSYEEFISHNPKPKRHPQQHDSHSDRHHKRHNSHRHHSDHKKHVKNDHHNHKKSKTKQAHNLPLPDSWIPMSSQEFFGKEEQIQFYKGNELGQNAQRYFQSIPLEITTPQPLQSVGDLNLLSTMYPPLSFVNQRVQNSPQSPFLGTVEPYKPFDYSILEPKLQNLKPNEDFLGEEVASSNIVNTKHSDRGKNKNPLSIIVVNSRENLGGKEVKHKQKDKKHDAGVQVDKSKKTAVHTRKRGGSRYRIRSKN